MFSPAHRSSLKKIPLLKFLYLVGSVFQYRPGLIRRAGALSRFFSNYRRFTHLKENTHLPAAFADLYPRLFDDTDSTPLDPVYFYQDAWCAEKIFAARPTRHVDIASHAHLVGILSGFCPVTFVDIRPLPVQLPNLHFTKGDITALPFASESIESLSSVCVIEHIGLGRYGDPLDPFGSEKAAAELTRVLGQNGDLYISVPVDTENHVYFNAHRAFARDYMLSLFKELALV